MSISIHHGYRLGRYDLVGLQTFLETARRILGVTGQELVTERLGEICSEIMDTAVVGTLNERRTVADKYFIREGQNFATPVSLAKDWLRNRMLECERSMLRDVYNDMGCELSLFAAEDGQVYGLLHAERAVYHRAFLTIPGVTRYEYSSGEPSQGVSLEEWEARRVLWDTMLRDGTPESTGIGCAKLARPNCTIESRKILEATPPAAERARTFARQRAIERHAAEIAAQMKASGDSRDATQQMLSSICRASEAVSNGELDAEINVEAKRLTGLLENVMTAPNMSREIMMLPWPESITDLIKDGNAETGKPGAREPQPSAHVVRLISSKRDARNAAGGHQPGTRKKR